MCGSPVEAAVGKCATCGEILSPASDRRAGSSFKTPSGNLLYLAPFVIAAVAGVLLSLIDWLRQKFNR
jgi:hypothetical protein